MCRREVVAIVRFVKRVNIVGWLFVVFVALLVEAGVRAFDYEQSIAPPSSTLRALYNRLADGTLSGEIGFTLHAYLEGLALAILIGVTAGVLIGSSRTLLDASSVVIEFLRPIPAVALIPLAIVLFGPFGIAAHRFVVVFAAVWPILINTLYGVRGTDRILHDVLAVPIGHGAVSEELEQVAHLQLAAMLDHVSLILRHVEDEIEELRRPSLGGRRQERGIVRQIADEESE